MLLVEDCQAKILALSERVSSSIELARKLRDSKGIKPNFDHQSLPDLRQESLAAMPARTCHHCHAPQANPVHLGIATGAGHCTLQHWEECQLRKQEGYDKRKKWWTGCPNLDAQLLDKTREDLDKTEDELDTSEDETEESENDEENVESTEFPNNLVEAAASMETAGLFGTKFFDLDASSDSDDDEEDRLAAEELEEIKQRIEEQEKQIKADELLAFKVAQKEKKRLERQQQRAELENKRIELLNREQMLSQKINSVKGLSKSAPRSSSNLTSEPLTTAQSSKNIAALKLKAKAAKHAAKQQKDAADRYKLEIANKMNIAGIRKLHGMNQLVESQLTDFQSIIPALAKDPSAPLYSGVQLQPQGVLNTAGGSMTVAPGYVYVAELGQLVPTVSSMGAAAVPGFTPAGIVKSSRKSQFKQHDTVQDLSDSEVSADEDCPVSPAPGYKLVWKIDKHGKEYCK